MKVRGRGETAVLYGLYTDANIWYSDEGEIIVVPFQEYW